jgi:hypothetical protein
VCETNFTKIYSYGKRKANKYFFVLFIFLGTFPLLNFFFRAIIPRTLMMYYLFISVFFNNGESIDLTEIFILHMLIEHYITNEFSLDRI